MPEEVLVLTRCVNSRSSQSLARSRLFIAFYQLTQAITNQTLNTTSVAPLDRRTREPGGYKAAILQVIKAEPMTSEEVAAQTGINSASARLSELLRDGYVKIAKGKRQSSSGKSVLVLEFVTGNPQRRPQPRQQ